MITGSYISSYTAVVVNSNGQIHAKVVQCFTNEWFRVLRSAIGLKNEALPA